VSRKNIAIFISGNEFIRNYLHTDAFKDLRRDSNLDLYIDSKLYLSPQQRMQFQEVYNFQSFNPRYATWLYTVHMLRFRSLSSSFRYRARRQFPNIYWQFIYAKNHKVMIPRVIREVNTDLAVGGDRNLNQKYENLFKVARQIIKLSVKFFLGKIRKSVYFLVSSRPLFPLTVFLLNSINRKQHFEFNPSVHYEFLLIPSSAYEPLVPRLIYEAKKQNTKTVLLVDNWDNLSSKSILWERPNILACWGPQSISHAINIQGMQPNSCVAIGTPRIDHYFSVRHKSIPSQFSFPYILFLGSSVPYKEAEFLAELDSEITKDRDAFLRHKVLYRPHPLRGGWQLPNIHALHNTIIDPDLEERFRSGDLRNNRSGQMPPLENYPNLLTNATIIVSGLTSMIFEGTIFWKKCTVLAFDEPFNLTNPRRMREEYLHFRGIENLPNLDLVFCQQEAIQSIRNNLSNPNVIRKDDIDKALSEFLLFDSTSYSARLNNVVKNNS